MNGGFSRIHTAVVFDVMRSDGGNSTTELKGFGLGQQVAG